MVYNYDLDLHVLQRYTGEARLQRLLWIATHTTTIADTTTSATTAGLTYHNNDNSELLALQKLAYESAVVVAMQQSNATKYKDIFDHYEEQCKFIRMNTNNQATTIGMQGGTSTSEGATTSTTAVLPATTTSNTYDMNYLSFDTVWYQDTMMTNRHGYEVLESRLQASQSHLNKDAIRVAFLAMAEYCMTRTGDVREAFTSVVRAKDYCTTLPQSTTITLHILLYAVLLRNYNAVREYADRLERTIAISSSTSNAAAAASATASASSSLDGTSSLVRNCVWTASGLERLAANDYKSAAKKFRSIALSGQNNSTVATANTNTNDTSYSPESTTTPGATGGMDAVMTTSSSSHTNWDTNLLAPEDIALYAGFLTLATEENQSIILQLAEDVEALELVPSMKEVLIQFVRFGHYKIAYTLLEKDILPLLRHDLYMSQHLDTLIQNIRNKAIVQYWKPYQQIALNVMAYELGSGIIQPPTVSSDTISMEHYIPKLNPNNNMDSVSSTAATTKQVATPAATMMLFQTLMHLITTNRDAIGYDTRIDLLNNTLVRINNVIVEENVHELERLHNTTQVLQSTSNRILNDTYIMMVKAACFENDICVVDRQRRGGGGAMGFAGPTSGVRWGADPYSVGQSVCIDDENDDNDYNNISGQYGGDGDDDGDISDDDEINDDTHMMDAPISDGRNPEDLY